MEPDNDHKGRHRDKEKARPGAANAGTGQGGAGDDETTITAPPDHASQPAGPKPGRLLYRDLADISAKLSHQRAARAWLLWALLCEIAYKKKSWRFVATRMQLAVLYRCDPQTIKNAAADLREVGKLLIIQGGFNHDKGINNPLTYQLFPFGGYQYGKDGKPPPPTGKILSPGTHKNFTTRLHINKNRDPFTTPLKEVSTAGSDAHRRRRSELPRLVDTSANEKNPNAPSGPGSPAAKSGTPTASATGGGKRGEYTPASYTPEQLEQARQRLPKKGGLQ